MHKFHQVSFPNDPVNYLCPNWDDMNHLAFAVSQQIKKQKTKFDRIVTLAKGGWPMTRSLVDFLEVPTVASIGVKFYSGLSQRLDRPQIYQDIPISVQGETVLLFDDVADTGESLIFTQDYLKTRGVKEIKTATLFYKPHSKLKPDFYGAETATWIVFPFEQFEMMALLNKKWSKNGVESQEIKQRFEEMKFSQDFIEACHAY